MHLVDNVWDRLFILIQTLNHQFRRNSKVNVFSKESYPNLKHSVCIEELLTEQVNKVVVTSLTQSCYYPIELNAIDMSLKLHVM